MGPALPHDLMYPCAHAGSWRPAVGGEPLLALCAHAAHELIHPSMCSPMRPCRQLAVYAKESMQRRGTGSLHELIRPPRRS